MTMLWPRKSQHQRQEKPMQPFKSWNERLPIAAALVAAGEVYV